MSISKAEHDELCCVYASLLLFDDKVEITADKLNKVITASGNTVEAYYPEFFAKYLSSVDLNTFLNNVGSAAPAAATAAAVEAPKGILDFGFNLFFELFFYELWFIIILAADKKEDKKKKVEEKPVEEEEAAGFGDLFG